MAEEENEVKDRDANSLLHRIPDLHPWLLAVFALEFVTVAFTTWSCVFNYGANNPIRLAGVIILLNLYLYNVGMFIASAAAVILIRIKPKRVSVMMQGVMKRVLLATAVGILMLTWILMSREFWTIR